MDLSDLVHAANLLANVANEGSHVMARPVLGAVPFLEAYNKFKSLPLETLKVKFISLGPDQRQIVENAFIAGLKMSDHNAQERIIVTVNSLEQLAVKYSEIMSVIKVLRLRLGF